MAAVADAGRCVFLAACRPSELAREYRADGEHPQGALTYWYLSMAGAAQQGLTFRTVYDSVLARIHSQFPDQTPMLFGDPDRTILGGTAAAAPASVAVDAVSNDGKTVTLAVGQASLAGPGVEFAVYPASADLADAKQRIASVRVRSVDATTVTADVSQVFGSRKIQIGDRAVALGVAQKLIRKVRVTPAQGAPPAAAKALRQVEDALKNQSWVEAAAAKDTADFVVTTSPDGAHFVICDAGGVPLEIRPGLPTSSAGSAVGVVGRLTHLARFQAVRSLDNPDPFSPLRGKLVVELFVTPKGFQKDDPPERLKKFPTGKASLKPGDWLVVSIANNSSQVLNVAILDLGPGWAISSAHPEEAFHPIDPGGEPWRLSLQAGLPEGKTSGKDVLKVIATVDPPPAYDQLTLPSLDQPLPASRRGAGIRGPGAASSPLDDLFAAVSAERPTRSLLSGGQPSRGWTVAHAEVEIG
jgi:hypothetical protein